MQKGKIMNRAYKKIKPLSDHTTYQLSPQGLHGDMNDFAWKLCEFVTNEVDPDLGKKLNTNWSTIIKFQNK